MNSKQIQWPDFKIGQACITAASGLATSHNIVWKGAHLAETVLHRAFNQIALEPIPAEFTELLAQMDREALPG
ncbi:MAG: hypothetical protein ABL973_09875 [Micropepsaceae bacterium]